MKTPINHELIVTIVKKGFADFVIAGAKEAGASGATILVGNGTNEEKNEFLGIQISDQKEIILIVTKKRLKKKIMTAILNCQDFSKEGNGICFSLPITSAVGLAGVLN